MGRDGAARVEDADKVEDAVKVEDELAKVEDEVVLLLSVAPDAPVKKARTVFAPSGTLMSPTTEARHE